jgi:hypothetical protein
MATDQTAKVATAPRGWPLFVAGVLLFVLGPGIYAGQMALGQTPMPWYLPILASLGVVLMAVSVWRRRGVLRSIGVVLFLALAGLEWTFFVALSKSPEYTGPAQTGTKAPPFETTLADGRSFSNMDFATGDATVLLFFRGHW